MTLGALAAFPFLWPLVGGVALLLGIGMGYLRIARRVVRLDKQLAIREQELADVELLLDQLQAERQELRQQLKDEQRLRQAEATRGRELEVRLQGEREKAVERLKLHQQLEQRWQREFENLANRIFSDSTQRIGEHNRVSLDGLLTPLKEQLEQFRRQVQQSYSEEARERHTLKYQLEQLKQLNQQMAEEAASLTRALKGDSKQQGNWGEVVLARILDESGLREGHEYQTQCSLTHEHGKRYQPDVIVHLPQDKDVIIDSKVSLTAYERFFNGDSDAEREAALQAHVQSLRNHIRELGRKNYHQLPGVRSLDYVLMFVALEPAFLVALEREPGLIKQALEHNILLVSPTNLMVALRTIENLWRYERQNQNAQLIASRAAKLYDKLRMFTDDLQQVGEALDKAHGSYDKAVNKLCQGRGNAIRQLEQLRDLGVEVSKPIAPVWLEREG